MTSPYANEFADNFSEMVVSLDTVPAQLDYFTAELPANKGYQAILAMGHHALPYMFLRMWAGVRWSWTMNFAAAKITGIDMRANPDWDISTGEDGLSVLWVHWWEKNYNDPKWK